MAKAISDLTEGVRPELRRVAAILPCIDVTAQSLQALRNAPAPEALNIASVREIHINRISAPQTVKGDLRLLVVEPKDKPASGAGVLYMHGGGFVFGSPEHALPQVQRWVAASGCTAVMPDYRLAPEHPFPAALQDGRLTLDWMRKQANGFELDSDRIHIAGDSAGGGHAVIIAADQARCGAGKIASLLLVYPMLDDRTGTSVMAAPGTGRLLWTEQSNAFGWASYLGGMDGPDLSNAMSVPTRLTDLSGFPPARIACGTLDLFHAESLCFANRLELAGVNVQTLFIEGAFHGFDAVMPDAACSAKMRTFFCEAIT